MIGFIINATRVLDIMTRAATTLAAIGLMLIVGSYVFEVFSRYIFSSPTAWASDFVAYALCAVSFLALPQVTKDRAHVAVSILVDIAPEKIANLVHMAISIFGFLFLMFASWISLQENLRQITREIKTLAIVPIPQWWVSSFITFGLALSAFYFLLYISPKNRLSNTISNEPPD
jgi:TRAP-type C4-dicarboxylate transport system permease small subunit